jgi:hypothetical protein
MLTRIPWVEVIGSMMAKGKDEIGKSKGKGNEGPPFRRLEQ